MAEKGDKDVVITYETLFEMLRMEKSREELQKLDPDFFDNVLGYLSEKRALFRQKSQQLDILNSNEAEKVRQQLVNIQKILKELYDRRERKIITMAANTAKTGTNLVDTSNLLKNERILFDTLSITLTDFRENVLCKVLNGEAPCKTGTNRESRLHMLEQSRSIVQKERMESQGESNTQEEGKGAYIQENISNNVKLRFLESIEEIVGPDLQIYGPFNAESEAELPRELAAALLNKGQAIPL